MLAQAVRMRYDVDNEPGLDQKTGTDDRKRGQIMALNPMALMKLKSRLSLFRRDHPKVSPFLSKVKEEGLREGTVLEVRVLTPEGNKQAMNIRLNANDIETLQMLLSLRGN